MTSRRELLEYEVARRHARGESIRQISRALGIARKTVRRILGDRDQRRRDGGDELQTPATPRRSKLDPHKQLVAALLRDYPDITATRIFEELQAAGFDGGYSIVRDYVRDQRPSPAPKAFRRVETPPGQQAQVDWSPYRIEAGIQIHALSVVLSHSRRLWIDFFEDQKRPSLLRGLISAFESFGGVPREVVFDNMRTVVRGWDNRRPVIQLAMLDFAAHYGFTIHLAPPRDAAYKGKVERPFRYLETNFFNGRRFASLEAARREMRAWLERANRRRHREIGDLRQAWERERHRLLPLPAVHYDARSLGWRVVDGYHHVRYESNRYSVPARFVGELLCVRASDEKVTIYDDRAQIVASHERAPAGKAQWVTSPEHVESRKPRRDIDALIRRFHELSEPAGRFAERVREHKRYAGQELSEILELRAAYTLDTIVEAIAHADEHRAYSRSAVTRILEVNATPRTLRDRLGEEARVSARQTMVNRPVQQRALAAYGRLFDGSSTAEETCDGGDEEEQGDDR